MSTDPHPETDTGLPRCQVEGARATVRLNRPAHHNRLHRADLLTLQRHCAELATQSHVRVVVLQAEGPTFCAGFNLDELDADAQGGPQLFEQTVEAIEALPMPTICRLQGSVFGGATDLALACDFRIGVTGMSLRMPAARIGLHYYPSGLRRYVSRLGLSTAKRLFLLAQTVDAAELWRIGYLDRVCEPGVLDAAVQEWVDALTAAAPLAIDGMKRSLDEIARGDYDLERLARRVARCAASDDLREGQAALAERRVPRFRGR
ncbi:MAG: enoyl-CoA hydratase/isomerase family protein [Burkholderiaceae bacterium]|nr:enoyl-CoA hydratase-related protein [Aquabacterium sp.]NUP84875.1 enoyl-CoA hydratase/isomerase family protein [Burkholderiaceae bacterium]